MFRSRGTNGESPIQIFADYSRTKLQEVVPEVTHTLHYR